MSNFNFYKFLIDNGYQKEVFREKNGKTFCTNYQKELSEHIWNSLTIHADKTFTAASPANGIEYKNHPQPTDQEEAEKILFKIEQV